MAASSLIKLSISSHHYRIHTPNSPRAAIGRPSYPSLHHHEFRRTAGKLSIPPKPTTTPPFSAQFSPPRKKILRFLVEKIATILLGSLIFAGSMKSMPALAVPVQENEVVEEERDEEEEMCERLLRQNPEDVEALKRAVNVKMRREKNGEAVGIVERLIELEPKEMEWRLVQALCYEMMGDLSKAESLFKNILEQNPLLLRALHGLAMVMHKNQEGAAVFEMLERALEVAGREEKVNVERNIRILVAQMHLIKGDLEEALKKFQALIDENPRDFRPYLCQQERNRNRSFRRICNAESRTNGEKATKQTQPPNSSRRFRRNCNAKTRTNGEKTTTFDTCCLFRCIWLTGDGLRCILCVPLSRGED